jgi:hypothetical protein
MSGARVRLQIDHLALHGFAASDASAIALALQDRLGALMENQGVPASLRRGGHIAALPSGRIAATADSTPAAAGDEIARAIFHSLQRGES